MQHYGYVVAYKDKDGFDRPVTTDMYDGERCVVFTNEESANKARIRTMSVLTDKLAKGNFTGKSKTKGMLWWKTTELVYEPLSDVEREKLKAKIKNLHVVRVKVA